MSETLKPNFLMLYIFLFIFGLLAGGVAFVVTSTPLMIGCGLGILWGDRRLWISAAAVFAAIVGRIWAEAQKSNNKDPAVQFFDAAMGHGVTFGVIACWLISLVIIWSIGERWEAKFSWSRFASAAIFAAMVGTVLKLR